MVEINLYRIVMIKISQHPRRCSLLPKPSASDSENRVIDHSTSLHRDGIFF